MTCADAINHRAIDHRVVIISHSGVAVWMKGNDIHAAVFGIKAVKDSRLHDEDVAADQSYAQLRLIRHKADAFTFIDDVYADRRMGMRRLRSLFGEVQMVKARVPLSNRRHKKGVGAAVDVTELTFILKRSAEDVEPGVIFCGGDCSYACTVYSSFTGDRKKVTSQEFADAILVFKENASAHHHAKVRIARR